MGWSYGGYMTLMALTTTTAFQARASPARRSPTGGSTTRTTPSAISACRAANASGYEASAVMPHAGALQGKLLLVHGMADDNVLFTHSTMLMQQLQSQSASRST